MIEFSLVFLESKVVLLRLVDRRVFFCFKVDLKKDSFLFFDLLFFFRSVFMFVLGERRLVMEEFLICFSFFRFFFILVWFIFGELGLELEVMLVLSEVRFCLEFFLFKFLFEVLFFLGGKGFFEVGFEVFLVDVEEIVYVRVGVDFCFWGEGDDAEFWYLGEDFFLGWAGIGEEWRLLVLEEEFVLFREREGFIEIFIGIGEEGDVFESDDFWFVNIGFFFRIFLFGLEAFLELGDFLVVFFGFFVREFGWLGGFIFLIGELFIELF